MNSITIDKICSTLSEEGGIEAAFSDQIDESKFYEVDLTPPDKTEPSQEDIDLFKELAGDIAIPSGGGGRRPPRGGGFEPSDDYKKEKADLIRYFSKDAVNSALRTEKDMTYAAMGLRLLNSMGKRLDNYEIHIPADYRLELLKRAGGFCEKANIFERLAQGKIQMFRPREQSDGGYLFRATSLPPNSVFVDGFSKEDQTYFDCYDHVHHYKKGSMLIPTSKTTNILYELFFKPTSQGGRGLTPESLMDKPLYLYIINPRTFTGVDIEYSGETFKKPAPAGQERWPFEQQEVGVPHKIDMRDIKAGYLVQARYKRGSKQEAEIELTNLQNNSKYILSHWEFAFDMRNLR